MWSYMSNLVQGSELARVQKQLEEQRKGNYSISYDKSDVNFEHLRRKRAFYKGVNIQMEQEMTDKGEVVGFGDVPDILPFKPKGQWDGLNYEELMATTATSEQLEEAKTSGTPGPNPHLFNYEAQDEASKSTLIDRFDLIGKRQIDMKMPDGLPAAVIFNTYTSGNRIEEIQGLLSGRDIECEIIECESDLDPFRKANELEIGEYSCMIAVGGDGTFNQMVNGMLARTDQRRIPVGLIPTGQSNDMARSFGLSSEMIASAIDNIAKGEAIAMDTIRVLLDHESESYLPEGEERLNHCRHMLSNSSLSMPAKIANGANTWKGCFGASSHSISTYLQAFMCGFVQDTYQLSIDDQPFSQSGVNTALMMINNGKYANGGMIINPFASINDGLIDITWIEDQDWQGTISVSGIMSEARTGGTQAYAGHSQYVRGRKIRIDIPAPEPIQPELQLDDGAAAATENGTATPQVPERPQQVIVIDGEALNYQTSIIWECFPANIEVLIDDQIFKTNGTFSRQITKEDEKNRVYTEAVDKIWVQFDADNSGELDKDETRRFLQVVLENIPPPHNYDESRFEQTFVEIDEDGNGLIEKHEMVAFIKKLLEQQKASGTGQPAQPM